MSELRRGTTTLWASRWRLKPWQASGARIIGNEPHWPPTAYVTCNAGPTGTFYTNRHGIEYDKSDSQMNDIHVHGLPSPKNDNSAAWLHGGQP